MYSFPNDAILINFFLWNTKAISNCFLFSSGSNWGSEAEIYRFLSSVWGHWPQMKYIGMNWKMSCFFYSSKLRSTVQNLMYYRQCCIISLYFIHPFHPLCCKRILNTLEIFNVARFRCISDKDIRNGKTIVGKFHFGVSEPNFCLYNFIYIERSVPKFHVPSALGEFSVVIQSLAGNLMNTSVFGRSKMNEEK